MGTAGFLPKTIAVVWVAVFSLLAAPAALAVHNTNHLELEGNITDQAGPPPPNAATAPDWGSLFDASGNPTAAGVDCAFAADELAQGGETDSTTFASSNKNNDLIGTWNWATGNVPVKDDLSNVYVCSRVVDGDLVIYAGAERLAPEGASHIDFQFYQDEIGLDKTPPCGIDRSAGLTDDPPCEFTGEKQVGDLVISMDFEQGGTLGAVTLRVWNGTEYVQVATSDPVEGSLQGCNATDTFCVFSNETAAIDGGPWPNYDRFGETITMLEAQQFSEFGINVTELLGNLTTPCIGTFVVKTRSAPSFTSELMDFALLPFNTCPTKSGTKYHDLNGNGQRDAGEPGLAGWTIRAYEDTDGDGVFDASEAAVAPAASAVTAADGTYTLTVAPGEYIVCEVLQAGWSQSDPGGTICQPGTGLGPGGYAIDLQPNEDETGNDFGNFQPANQTGVKFEDLDADGVKDAGEPGLAGWVINAYVDTNENGIRDAGENTIAATATTGAGGVYSLTLLLPGRYVVCEVQQANWTQSFPDNDVCGPNLGGWAINFVSGQLDPNIDFGNFRQATKSGTKFHDLNASRLRDAGEPGLAGWTINAFVDANANGLLDPGEMTLAASATTNASGAYSLGLAPGSYIICEAQQAAWIQSFPVNNVCGTGFGGHGITLVSGEVETGNDFGNYQLATKTGTKFDDLDADGVKDAGEPGLAGWAITIYDDENGNGVLDAGEVVVGTDTTDAAGVYSFQVDPGRYVVCETQQATWTQSYPANNACGTGLGGWGITLTSGQTDSGNDFGNFRQPTKTGTKFHDLDADGVRDAGEPGLAGWTITAYVDTNGNGVRDAGETTVADSDVTLASGAYTLTLNPGRYVVCETQQATWTQSHPAGTACGANAGGHAITLTSGQTDSGNDFGNFQRATKSGVKYHDQNRNGARDAGEPGLAGWVIRAYADANANGVLEAGETTIAASATTDANGAYSMSLVPGRYVVCEVLQPTWRQEQPTGTACAAVAGLGAGGYGIALTSGQVDADNNFGNSTIVNLAITKVDTPDPVFVGQNITYTVTVTNTSQHTATQVVLTDPLPLDRVTFISASASQGTCAGSAPLVCQLGTMAPGATVTLTIVVRANVAGTVVNPARVVGREEETTLTDNEARAETLVVAPVCESLRITPRSTRVGVRTIVRATVRGSDGAAMAGVRVTARGRGISQVVRTNAAGMARFVIRPRFGGTITFRVNGSTVCVARLRVRAIPVPPPPVTGRP